MAGQWSAVPGRGWHRGSQTILWDVFGAVLAQEVPAS